MNLSKTLLLTATAALLGLASLPAADRANSQAEAIGNGALSMPGVGPGTTAPAFALSDASGNEISLGGLLAQGRVALVFFRSADWCPFCIAQLKELQAALPQFSAAGLQLVGISYDAPDVLARAAQKHGITFPLLSDAGSKTIDAYGIRNEEAKGRGDGIPHPAVFVVDASGVIRAKLMHEGYRTRPSPADIIAAAPASP